MTRDITAKIQSTFSQTSLWSKEKFCSYLNLFATSTQGATKDWDEYAGENWGRVLVQKQPIVYLHRASPLVFVQEKFQDVVAQYNDLQIITFFDPDEEIYSLNPTFFEKWSQGRSKTGGLKEDSLSVSDIWWATVL